MNQDKVDMVKQEMARVNINIFGISEINWRGMGKFNIQNTIISTIVGRKPLQKKKNGVALIVNSWVWNAISE